MNPRQLLMILIAVLLVGCGTQAPPQAAAPTATDEPEATANSESESPEDAALPGEALFKSFNEDVQFACSTCHYPDTDTRLLGPGLWSIEERYETYEVESDSLEAYIRESILEPRAFIVPDDSPFPKNIMPITYGEIFSDEEIDHLVAYILSF